MIGVTKIIDSHQKSLRNNRVFYPCCLAVFISHLNELTYIKEGSPHLVFH